MILARVFLNEVSRPIDMINKSSCMYLGNDCGNDSFAKTIEWIGMRNRTGGWVERVHIAQISKIP